MLLKVKYIQAMAIDAYQQVQIVREKELLFDGTIYKIPPRFDDAQILRWAVDKETLILHVKYT